MAGLLTVGEGMVRPLGSVVTSLGTPEPLVARTALLAGVVPDTAVPVEA